MSGVGPGVREIRIHTELEHRVFYVATFEDAIYVVHAFEKRTRKTPTHEVRLARDRYRELMNERRAADAKEKIEGHSVERQCLPRSRVLE